MLKKIFNKRTLVIAVGLTGFLFVSTNLVLASTLQDRVYPGVKVGNIDLSGMTRVEALQTLKAQVKAYHLSLVVENVKYNFKPRDLGADYDTTLTVDQAFSEGRDQLLPILGMIEASRRKPLTLAYSIDRVALAKFASSFVSQQTAAPVDAAIVIKDGVPTVRPDKPGLGVNTQALLSALEASVGANVEQLTIQRGPVPAEVSAAEAQTVADTAKQLIGTQIKLLHEDKVFAPSAAQIGAWITFSKQPDGMLAMEVDSGRVENYLKSIAPSIEIPAVTKKISVVNGEVKSEEGGSDGTAIDKASLVPQIVAAIKAVKPASITIPMVTVAFKTQYNRTVSLDAPKYIEVNLSSQHLWAYQDHQVVYDSPVTSGATGYGFGTVTGLFSIYAKETNRYLDGRPLGYNYNVFVQYWMPFYADYGLHDASWRNGSFGGQDYYYGGSHGCVNLPTATAAWLFGWAPVGTPVWVHL